MFIPSRHSTRLILIGLSLCLGIACGPAEPLVVQPSTVAFTSAGTTSLVTVSENRYTEIFSVASANCDGIANVTPASVSGPDATLSVTSVAAGACTLEITDKGGQKAGVRVGVTTTTVTLQ